jgi:hypothetical protein
MKQLSELKQSDIIYDIESNEVKWYKYLCVHPTGQGRYHILIDSFKEPIRIYEKKLQNILNKDFKNYQEAKLALADNLEESAKQLRQESESIE